MIRAVGVFLLAAALLFSLPVVASGSYTGGPPRTPVHTDPARYELGRAVFLGKATLPAPSSPLPDLHERCLKEWQAKIPRSARKDIDLPALAGRLTDPQFKALAYFIEVRFNVRCEALPKP